MNNNYILLIEPHPYHSEVLPGIAYYFEKLGFIVDVFIREEIIFEDVFCRHNLSGKLIPYKKESLPFILSDDSLSKYDYVFISSMEHCEDGYDRKTLEESPCFPKTKKGVLGIYHNINLIDIFEDYELLKTNRLFCLSLFQKKYTELNILSPSWFGDVNIKYSLGAEKKNLLLVGTSNDYCILQKGYWLLRKKERENLNIVHAGVVRKQDVVHRFYIFVKGLFFHRNKKIKSIKELGRVNFPILYQEVEKCDFLLSLINPNSKYQHHYIEYSTSGLRQLIIGFCKPCIMHECVAKSYGLPCGSYIPYTDNFENALRLSMNISGDDYKKMVNILEEYKNNVLQNSLESLKSVLNI